MIPLPVYISVAVLQMQASMLEQASNLEIQCKYPTQVLLIKVHWSRADTHTHTHTHTIGCPTSRSKGDVSCISEKSLKTTRSLSSLR